MKKNPNLSAEQKLVMFEDGTEPPGTSELNNEKREGSYHCANCGIKLFDSKSSIKIFPASPRLMRYFAATATSLNTQYPAPQSKFA